MGRALGDHKADKQVQQWVKDYGLTWHQLGPETVEHLKKCTPLGQEIMLIIMRLEHGQVWRHRVKAQISAIGVQHRESNRQRRRMLDEARRRRNQERIQRALTKPERKPVKRQDPWKNYAKWSDEDGAMVSKLMRLAERAMA